MDRFQKYQRLETWAKRRYMRPDGSYMTRGAGLDVPSRYARIEDLAGTRYLYCRESWPGFRVMDCPNGLNGELSYPVKRRQKEERKR